MRMSINLNSNNNGFAERLTAKISELANPTVLGLDPMLEYVPANIRDYLSDRCSDQLLVAGMAITEFNRRLIDAVYDIIPAVKPQLAYYEQYGRPGMDAFYETCRYARTKGMLVIADGKRNDIGTTAAAYARAYLGETQLETESRAIAEVDALTINPYLGSDGIEPFLEQCSLHSKGVFILVRTSNPSAGDLQDLKLADGRLVYESVADMVHKWGSGRAGASGFGPVGAVVGATYPHQAAGLRERLPEAIILVPGYGAQGATAADCAHNFTADGRGAIVNASRSLMLAYKKRELPPEAFDVACREEAIAMRQALQAAITNR
ncbi:MAG: orotidine-5'-phosphate decarboxylase [Saccharofermentanales bacterium]|jgi:orotidine-5'-phosphate decarboxylase